MDSDFKNVQNLGTFFDFPNFLTIKENGTFSTELTEKTGTISNIRTKKIMPSEGNLVCRD